MRGKPRKTAANHAPTGSKTMGVTVAKQQSDDFNPMNHDNDSNDAQQYDIRVTDNGREKSISSCSSDVFDDRANAAARADKMNDAARDAENDLVYYVAPTEVDK